MIGAAAGSSAALPKIAKLLIARRYELESQAGTVTLGGHLTTYGQRSLRETLSLRIMALKVVRASLPADHHVPDVPTGAASSSAGYSAATALGEINF
jgi:hypothetical protein